MKRAHKIINMFKEKIPKKYLPKIHKINTGKKSNKLPKLLGKFTLELLRDLEKEKISVKEADYIFEYLEELSINLFKISEIDQLIFEGRLLHDLGKKYGSNLKLMKKLAKFLIEYKQEKEIKK